MTYNFDPDRWYENEHSFIEQCSRLEEWEDTRYEAMLEDLDRRYDLLVKRLDGAYQIPKGSIAEFNKPARTASTTHAIGL